MNQKYFYIEPCLDDTESYVDDWGFEYWPNKPKGEIIKNPNGTFSVVMAENFIPLVTQLQNLFKEGKKPDDGTYIGEAILTGRKAPNDLVWSQGFVNGDGLLISKQLFAILKRFDIPNYCTYAIPLIQNKKHHDSYLYISFNKKDGKKHHDIRFEGSSKVLVSERLKMEIENIGLKGCEFKLEK